MNNIIGEGDGEGEDEGETEVEKKNKYRLHKKKKDGSSGVVHISIVGMLSSRASSISLISSGVMRKTYSLQ